MLFGVGICAQDRFLGPRTARVHIVLYADYECPHSKRAYRSVKELASWYGNLVCIAFRHLPLSARHAHALDAAEAAESAHSQGLFWEMGDCLFEQQQLLDRPHLLRYARTLELDVQRFEAELTSSVHRPRLRKEIAQTMALGVGSAPSLFVNERPIDGLDYDDLFEAVEGALNSQSLHLVAGRV